MQPTVRVGEAQERQRNGPGPAQKRRATPAASDSVKYKVKGSTIVSKIEFVRDRFGPSAAHRLTQELTAAGAPLIIASAWYPFSVYDDLNVTIAQRFLGGSLEHLVELGEFSAHSALNGTYAAYARNKEFPQFLTRIATLHEQLYSHGKARVSVAPNRLSSRIVLMGAPVYTKADLYLSQGFYLGAGKFMGLDAIRVAWRLEEDRAVFQLNW